MESGKLIVRELRVGELKCTFSLSGVYLQVSEESIKDTFNSLWQASYLDSIFSSIPLKKMRSNSLKSPALDSASTKLAGGFSGPSSRQAILKDTGWGNLEETVSVKNRLSLGIITSIDEVTKRRGQVNGLF